MNSPPPMLDEDDVSVTAAASVSSSSMSSMQSQRSDAISFESLLSSHSDGTNDIVIKRQKLEHYARLLGISEESLREHIDESNSNDVADNEQKATMTTSKSTSSMPSSSATGDDSINMSYSSSSRSSSTDVDGSFGAHVTSADSTCAAPSSQQQQQQQQQRINVAMRRPSCVSSICSGSVLESIPEEDDPDCIISYENKEEGGDDDNKEELPTSSIPPLPSTITTITAPSTTTAPNTTRRSSVGKPPLIPPTPTMSTAVAIDAPANDNEHEYDDDDDDGEEEDLSGVSLLIEDLYPNAFDSTPSSTAGRDDDSTNGSVDARSVGTAETEGDVSTKSKPDPPESPVEAAKLRSRGGSPDSMHIDATLEVTPVIGNRARKGSTDSIHIDDMFFDNDLHVLTSSESGNRERKGSLESMDVIIPDDFESAASNLSSCGVSDYQKYHHALLTQFLASPDLMGGSTPTSSNTDEFRGQTTSNVVLQEEERDTEGRQIAKMIVDLNSRLAKIDSGLNTGTSMAAESISELSAVTTDSKKSAASDASSILLNIVKDVKLELADVNVNFDAYRMKQRHLTEENELLTRQKAHLEEQLDAITKDRDELRSELKMTLCIMSAEQKKLREALIAQTQLRVELEASQSRLLEASKSEKKANITMMNMMQHRRNSSDSEIFDFDPDFINKKVCGDEGTIATQDVTNYESRRSIYSSSLSTIDSGSRRSLGSATTTSTPPSRGFLRRFSNMFGNSNEDMNVAPATSAVRSRQQPCRRHSDDGCVRRTTSGCEDDEASHSDSTTFGGQTKSDPRPKHMRRASISGCNFGSMSTSSIIDQHETEGTMPLSLEPRQSMKLFHASTRSINTQNDVQSFLGKLDLMEDVGSEISGSAISGSAV